MKIENKLLLRFSIAFILLFSLFYVGSSLYKNFLINNEVNGAVERLEESFQAVLYYDTLYAKSVHKLLQNNSEVLTLFAEAAQSNENQQADLRNTLYKLLEQPFMSMQLRGVSELQFIFADNKSFLKFHDMKHFGDEVIQNILNISNLQMQSGFYLHDNSYAFKNTFPLYNKKNVFIGSVEISFLAEDIQENLAKINQSSTHFLLHKKNLDKNIFQNGKNEFYIADTFQEKDLTLEEKEFFSTHKKGLKNSIFKEEKFALFHEKDQTAYFMVFLPIKDVSNNKTVSYLTSLSNNNDIYNILCSFRIVNITAFFSLFIIFYLSYRQAKIKRDLQNTTKEQTELLSLFNKGNIALFKWKNNPSWDVEYVSKNISRVLGYECDDFLSQKTSYASIIHSDDLEKVLAEVKNAIQNHLETFIHEPYRVVKKSGEILWLLDTSYIIRNKNNEITHFLGYISDITKKKLLEIQLRELNENLHNEVEKQTEENIKKDKILQEQSKLAAMGEMVGAIAHQWRQPLNSLNINIQNLDDDYEDGFINKGFINDFIHKQSQTIQFMSKTIDDFRNFFRVDKIKMSFSILETLNATISIQAAQLKNNNINVNISGEDFQINTLQSEFSQVLLNLITNAKDAIVENKVEHGEIIITLEKNRISIEDNGGGVPSEIIDRIFEPYFTTKPQGKGTGMGLYMSKMIIEQNIGGSLSVYPISNGIAFVITFDESAL